MFVLLVFYITFHIISTAFGVVMVSVLPSNTIDRCLAEKLQIFNLIVFGLVVPGFQCDNVSVESTS